MCLSDRTKSEDPKCCSEVSFLSCDVVKQRRRLASSAEVSLRDKRQAVEFQVNTDAKVSLLSLTFSQKNFKGVRVLPTNTKLHGAERMCLDVGRVLPVQVTFADRQASVEFSVIGSATTETIMGLDLVT